MAETVLVSGVTEILNKLTAVIDQEIVLVWPLNGDLGKLKDTLEMISAVTSDAERCQVNDQAVRLWLTKLKEAAYDADDLLDEFSYQVMRRKGKDSLLFKVKDFFSSSNYLVFKARMAHRMKDINGILDEIDREKEAFNLNRNGGRRVTRFVRPPTTIVRNNRQAPAAVTELGKIIGRENDRKKLVDLLIGSPATSSSKNNTGQNAHERIQVIPVVGMAGIGKTKLAELVSRDELVKEHFDLNLWICVSDDFDLNSILINILESIDGTKYDIGPNLDSRVKHLQGKLQGKRYLLVLDDLLNEDLGKWGILKDCLNSGSDGSKILVTTCENCVAEMVQGNIPPHHLEPLSVDQCWSIIEQRAFSPGGAPRTAKMVKIGKEIAVKCCGSPLAAEILANVMRLRKGEREWVSIRDIEIMEKAEFDGEKIRPIIKLSYNHLSSNLRQCFSYCSLFPRGWVIDREALIQLWMAEGFLASPGPGSSCRGTQPEDIGNEYFKDLVSHSLFQNVELDEFNEISKCKMHDLVYYLSCTVASNKEYSAMGPDEASISQARRLRLVYEEDTKKEFPAAVSNASKLRTFVATDMGDCNNLQSLFNNRNLRVLYLNGSLIKSLPASISKLRHLRYLNLSRCQQLSVLHAGSMNRLYKLQTLILHGCSSLSELPEDLGLMKYLRHLDISFTGITRLPDSVTKLRDLQSLDASNCKMFTELPEDIGAWKELRSLDISHTKVSVLPVSITDLLNLDKLRLHSCPNLTALPRGMKKLISLRDIDISGTQIKEQMESLSSSTAS